MTNQDSELDDILQSLHKDARDGRDARDAGGSMADIRARLLAEAAIEMSGIPRRRRRFPFVPVAAAVAAVVGIVAGVTVVAVQLHSGTERGTAIGTPPATAQRPAISLKSGAAALDGAATLLSHNEAVPLKPGQFRYIRRDTLVEQSQSDLQPAGSTAPAPGFSVQKNQVIEDWIPADYTQEWMEKRTIVGQPTWLGGSMPQSEAPKLVQIPYQSGTFTGKCGDFFPNSQDKQTCGDPTDWSQPAFYTHLPRDPAGLLAFLHQEASPKGGSPETMFAEGLQIMDSGVMPADLLAPWYRALAMIPGVQVLDKQANLHGQVGVALGLDDDNGAQFQELIVDPNTGEFIGEREVAGPHPYDSWIKPGTVVGDSAVSTAVVDRLGERPGN